MYTTAYSWASGRLTNVSSSASIGVNLRFSYSYVPNSDPLQATTYLDGACAVSRAYDDLDRLTNINAVAVTDQNDTVEHSRIKPV